jgi:SAM-dependent methyltransferase
MNDKLREKQRIEIAYWKDSPAERPESDSIYNIVNKMTDVPVLLDCLHRYGEIFGNAGNILELGGGQGWASCVVKKLYPKASVAVTDISEYAVASVHKWEHVFGVKIDQAAACKSYEIPREDSSQDLIFTFAAAHHFVAQGRTLREIHRVLKPGGHCFYFYEPSCPDFIHKAAYWRLNRKRPEVPEDVLKYRKMRGIARRSGLSCALQFYPSLLKRGPLETGYYYFLNKIPFLQKILPCTINYHFTK